MVKFALALIEALADVVESVCLLEVKLLIPIIGRVSALFHSEGGGGGGVKNLPMYLKEWVSQCLSLS